MGMSSRCKMCLKQIEKLQTAEYENIEHKKNPLIILLSRLSLNKQCVMYLRLTLITLVRLKLFLWKTQPDRSIRTHNFIHPADLQYRSTQAFTFLNMLVLSAGEIRNVALATKWNKFAVEALKLITGIKWNLKCN